MSALIRQGFDPAGVLTRMPPNGAGSQRIVVLGEPRAARDVPPSRRAAAARSRSGAAADRLDTATADDRRRARRDRGARSAASSSSSKFGVMGANDSPFLAVGFGLFVIGMVVFCAGLIALVGTGVSAARRAARLAVGRDRDLRPARARLGAVFARRRRLRDPRRDLARVDRRARRRLECPRHGSVGPGP